MASSCSCFGDWASRRRWFRSSTKVRAFSASEDGDDEHDLVTTQPLTRQGPAASRSPCSVDDTSSATQNDTVGGLHAGTGKGVQPGPSEARMNETPLQAFVREHGLIDRSALDTVGVLAHMCQDEEEIFLSDSSRQTIQAAKKLAARSMKITSTQMTTYGPKSSSKLERANGLKSQFIEKQAPCRYSDLQMSATKAVISAVRDLQYYDIPVDRTPSPDNARPLRLLKPIPASRLVRPWTAKGPRPPPTCTVTGSERVMMSYAYEEGIDVGGSSSTESAENPSIKDDRTLLGGAENFAQDGLVLQDLEDDLDFASDKDEELKFSDCNSDVSAGDEIPVDQSESRSSSSLLNRIGQSPVMAFFRRMARKRPKAAKGKRTPCRPTS